MVTLTDFVHRLSNARTTLQVKQTTPMKRNNLFLTTGSSKTEMVYRD